jgi:hypothetical protein
MNVTSGTEERDTALRLRVREVDKRSAGTGRHV